MTAEEEAEVRRLYDESEQDYYDTVAGLKRGERYVRKAEYERVCGQLAVAEAEIARLKAELARLQRPDA